MIERRRDAATRNRSPAPASGCKSCRDAWDADFAAGKGDVPLVQMKWRCGTCGSRLNEFIPHEAEQRLVIIGAAGQFVHQRQGYRLRVITGATW